MIPYPKVGDRFKVKGQKLKSHNATLVVKKAAVIYLPQYGEQLHHTLILDSFKDDEVWWFTPVGEFGMQKVNLYAFYQFGTRLRQAVTMPLQPILEQFERNDDFPNPENLQVLGTMEVVYANCLAFAKHTEGYKLPKSRAKVKEIEAVHLQYWDLIGKAHAADLSDTALYTRWMRRTNRLVGEFEEILKHEITSINAFVTGDKGDKDTDVLAERASEGFPAEVRKHLPDTAIYDFNEAGKCYLFDCYTAMAYHILRAVEAVSRKYLEVVKGSPYTGTPGFGQYIGALGAKKLAVPIRILQRLDEMREYERNPIAHPEFVVEADDALSMYNLAYGVVPMMTKEIETKWNHGDIKLIDAAKNIEDVERNLADVPFGQPINYDLAVGVIVK